MSTTLQTFNHTISEFLDELSLTFEEVPQIKLYQAGLPALLEKDERTALKFFMNATKKHGDKIISKDPSLFEEDVVDLGMNLHLSDLWHADGLDDDTREAIWNYLSSLFILGTTIDSLDDSMLQSIETLANNTARQLKAQGSMDIASVLPGLFQSVIQSVMGSMNFAGMQDMLPGPEDDDDMPDAEV